ncbi:uncharacterized protein LOC143354830 [Halictus rubicundus]|uniref:uncharacterized protein LOC143354830 n=1 Tax=Halictus rubicundus TaxID=77578 RepID=UPI0040363567
MKTVEGKVVALGSQGVGKTSMIIRFIRKILCEQVHPTVGAHFFTCTMNVENTRVVLKVWDTAGQEKFRSMAPMYYRNANAALLVFDLTRYDTFTAVKDWVTELRKNVEESIVMVVIGNKSDLKEQREVDAEEGRAYATKIGAGYHETSVVLDDGIENVFLDVGRGLLRLSSTEATNSVGPDNTGMPVTVIDEEAHAGRNISIVHEEFQKPRTCC